MNPASAVSIAQAGTRLVGRLRAAAGRQASAAWVAVGNVDDVAAERFVTATVPLVQAAQAQAATATAAYLGRILGETPAVDLAAALAARGVPPADVYARVAVEARTALAAGQPWGTAMRQAAARANTLAETDVQLAARQAAGQVLEGARSRVVGYRRVPDAGACELCLIAATQRYHVRQLMPIHNHCGCGVIPIVGSDDPGNIIDREAHARLKAAGAIDRISEQRRNARARVLAGDAPASEVVAVHEHGELGPVLTPAGQHFTGNPADRIVGELGAAGAR